MHASFSVGSRVTRKNRERRVKCKWINNKDVLVKKKHYSLFILHANVPGRPVLLLADPRQPPLGGTQLSSSPWSPAQLPAAELLPGLL